MKPSPRLLAIPMLCLLLAPSLSHAQFTRYIVWLKNKGGNSFTLSNPSAYLSNRSLQRRTNQQLTVDSSDLPVTTAYINAIRAIPNVTILNVSKWLNAVCIQTGSAAAMTAIQQLPFVQSTGGLAARNATGRIDKFGRSELITPLPASTQKGEGLTGDFYNYGTSSATEIKLHKGDFLHNIGLRGKGMQVAVLDGGFFNYNTLRSFDSVNRNGQILGTWDFVAGHASVAEDHPHGMQCLSTIAANIPGQFIGKAPEASFYLFRTEDVNSEYPIEEFNWVCGAERADSAGVDIISSSLGYYDFDNSVFNYAYSQFNGNTTISVKGADLAAKKGILVFNSAGNEGTSAWRYIVTPSDGDSVLAVGAVNAQGVVGGFSSYGPAANGRIKPDLASVGVNAIVQSPGNTISVANGTSFACPNMAGLGTCLWQGFPEFNNMKIAEALKRAGSRFTNPDDRVGYGIPDLQQAFSWLLSEYGTLTATTATCSVTLGWKSKDVESMRYQVQRKLTGQTNYTTIYQAVPAAATTLTNRTYQYVDTWNTITPGPVSYRIVQMIDTNAATQKLVYLDSVQVVATSPCSNVTTAVLQVYPNPAGHSTKLVINTPQASSNIQVVLTNAEGQQVDRFVLNKPAGSYNKELSLQRFAKGVYFISVWDGSEKLGTLRLLHD